MSEPPESAPVRVKIYDREYALRTTGNPERLRALSDSLDKKMRDVAAQSGTADTLKVAVLAALSLEDDLLRVSDELRRLDESVAQRSLACGSLLDQILT